MPLNTGCSQFQSHPASSLPLLSPAICPLQPHISQPPLFSIHTHLPTPLQLPSHLPSSSATAPPLPSHLPSPAPHLPAAPPLHPHPSASPIATSQPSALSSSVTAPPLPSHLPPPSPPLPATSPLHPHPSASLIATSQPSALSSSATAPPLPSHLPPPSPRPLLSPAALCLTSKTTHSPQRLPRVPSCPLQQPVPGALGSGSPRARGGTPRPAPRGRLGCGAGGLGVGAAPARLSRLLSLWPSAGTGRGSPAGRRAGLKGREAHAVSLSLSLGSAAGAAAGQRPTGAAGMKTPSPEKEQEL
ncbi:unnamed protein product [Caretta caretta]